MSVQLHGEPLGELIDCVPTISANITTTGFPSLLDMVHTVQKNGNKHTDYTLNLSTDAFTASISIVDELFYRDTLWVLTEDDGYFDGYKVVIYCTPVSYSGECDHQDQGTIALTFVPQSAGLFPSESLYPSNALYPDG